MLKNGRFLAPPRANRIMTINFMPWRSETEKGCDFTAKFARLARKYGGTGNSG
jgi:hypothetical protein